MTARGVPPASEGRAPAADPPERERARWPIALALFALALALYARTGRFEFVEYDDPAYVRDNPHLASGLTAENVRWAFTSTDYQYNWHPLTWLAHALDVELFGLDAGAHHLVNAGLHALAAALLFLGLHALTRVSAASALAAALFALHPLRVESVAWVSERKDLLAGCCFGLLLLAYARHARAPSRARMALVTLVLAAGLAAKPTLVTAPFLLLLLDVWPLGRSPARAARGAHALVLEKTPLFVLALGSCALTLLAQHSGGAVQGAPLSQRLVNAPIAYATYLREYVWPVDLAFFHPHPGLVDPERSRLGELLPSLLVLAVLSSLALRALPRRPWIFVGWCWFLGLLVPMIGLVQVGTMAHADRYAYLALIGPELALAFSLREWARTHPRLRPALVGPTAVVLAALALLAWRQAGTWRDSEALFTRALQVTERNFVAHNNLGLVRARDGELDGALEQFEAATAAWPGFHEGWLNAGIAHYRRSDLAAARSSLEHAVALRPASREGRVHLVATLARLGHLELARAELVRGFDLDPGLRDDPRALELEQRLAAREGG